MGIGRKQIADRNLIENGPPERQRHSRFGQTMINSIKNACFSLPQYLLPQHALSRIMHWLTRSEVRWWKNLAIRSVVSLYRVDLDEARQSDYSAYSSFNHFFTRELKESVRPVNQDDDVVVSPADGAVSQIGPIDGNDILQAKGRRFGLLELLGGEPELADCFAGGYFATIYLSPRDYHRLHMPCRGTLTEMRHIPGRLFSVNNATAAVVPNLFAKNERVVALFETPLGRMALVLIGAIFVSSIETVWHGVVTPPRSRMMRNWSYRNNPVMLQQGQEMGRFNMGSTVIALFEPDRITWSPHLQAGSAVKMGQPIGYRRIPARPG
jgi:phosphatidylserine decarboxylase